MAHNSATWREFYRGAPEIAHLGLVRINATRVAMLGTLRRDGSPRISPIEPYLVADHMLVGSMTWSTKTADLRRDPRYVLHSLVSGPDSGEGEFKLSGLAREVGDQLRDAASGAWWSACSPDRAVVFSLDVEQATYVEWDTEHGSMTVRRWSPLLGYSQRLRAYP